MIFILALSIQDAIRGEWNFGGFTATVSDELYATVWKNGAQQDSLALSFQIEIDGDKAVLTGDRIAKTLKLDAESRTATDFEDLFVELSGDSNISVKIGDKVYRGLKEPRKTITAVQFVANHPFSLIFGSSSLLSFIIFYVSVKNYRAAVRDKKNK